MTLYIKLVLRFSTDIRYGAHLAISSLLSSSVFSSGSPRMCITDKLSRQAFTRVLPTYAVSCANSNENMLILHEVSCSPHTDYIEYKTSTETQLAG